MQQKTHRKKPLTPDLAGPEKNRTNYWVAGGLLLTLAVYLPSLLNGVTNWDDYIYLDNPYIRDLSPSGIGKLFSIFIIGNYQPLTLLSFGIDRLIGGDAPFIHHLTNLLLHLFNTWMVFLLVRRLTGNDPIAIATFLLFGVHPLHVESVAWIAERKDVLYAFFFLASLLAYTRFAAGKRWLFYSWSLLFFILSSLSKGQAVVLVAILPFIDHLLNRKWFSPAVAAEKIPFIILAVVFTWVGFQAQVSAGALWRGGYSHIEQFAFASYGLAQYILKSIVPAGLSAIYPYPGRLPGEHIPSFYWLFLVAFPLFFTASYFLVRRSRLMAFGLALFFAGLLPVLQLIPVGGAIMADRYFYIPSVGLLLVFAAGLNAIRHTTLRISLLLGFVAFFSVLTIVRCGVWKDSISLWSDVIGKTQSYPGAYSNRGRAYAEEGRLREAVDDYTAALALDPGFTKAAYNRGLLFASLGEWENAVADFTAVIDRDPFDSLALYNRGVALSNSRMWEKAIADFTVVTGLKPDHASAWLNLGVACSVLKKWDQGIDAFSRAITLQPGSAKARLNRGLAFYYIGEYAKAIDDFNQTLRIDPESAKARYNRGKSYEKLKEWEKAREDYSATLRMDPGFASAAASLDSLRLRGKTE